MMYTAYKLNKQGNNIQPWRTPFPIWNQSVVPCPVLTVASWPAYRFFKRQVRWSGIPIYLIISALLTVPKPLTLWITIDCGKSWKRWEHRTTWPASWETYMQVRNQQLEPDMEQWFKIRKGVCQGCILSPCLINLYVEYIMWNAGLDWSTSWNQDCQEKYQ